VNLTLAVVRFRTAGAPFPAGYSTTQIYFAAQHYGLPTRLLDWSTNPLAALFFACSGESCEQGYVYAMDAGKIIPENAEESKGKKLYQSVMTMRNKYVESAIGLSFWDESSGKRNRFVLPVRPNESPGRIAQQSSCFTLHMHEAPSARNPTMNTIAVDASSKDKIRQELHRVNINQFTTYYDLDHFSKEITKCWGC
jgi:FRG domain